ncbi:hypothetical protein FO519_009327 [Halicephalobus sp. NKZ332]|nr:hypothetical protein FO519_009327 [Halicephalobus sp. NKZ332]
MIVDSWPEEMMDSRPKTPFSRMTFETAMSKYGSDKPDLRIPWMIDDFSTYFGDDTQAFGWVIRATEGKLPSSNNLRRNFSRLFPDSLHKKADLLDLRSKKSFVFTWITDFPLFVESEENADVLESAHHPFTAPVEKDKKKLINLEDLKNIRAQHYDLVVNGVEMGGGSIRIHNPELQKKVIEKVLKFPIDSLNPFLQALSFGAPPHGGFALGLDRYVTCLASGGDSKATVRDVIAFPKTKEGRCLMMKTPFKPDQEMKKRYALEFVKEEEKN